MSAMRTPRFKRRRYLREIIDDEVLLAVLQRGLDDPGETAGPVMAVSSKQPDVAAMALHAQAVTVILDLMEPVGAGRDRLGGRRQAELNGSKYAWDLCMVAGNAKSV